MNSCPLRESCVPQHLCQCHIAHWASRARRRGKDQARVVAKRANSIQHLQCGVAERDAMLGLLDRVSPWTSRRRRILASACNFGCNRESA